MCSSRAGGGATRPAYFYEQSAAIPLRRRAETGATPGPEPGFTGQAAPEADGGAVALEVLMVSSRSGKRWVVPKGIVEPGLSPADSAANEAWEEAGVRGSVRPSSVGVYQYHKWGGTCRVEVFVLDVEQVEDSWPEQGLRERRWLSLQDAAELVREPDLAEMIRTLG